MMFAPSVSSNAIKPLRRNVLIFVAVSTTLICIGIVGGAIFLRQLRTQLYSQQDESARRNAEAMAHILERDLQSGRPPQEVVKLLQDSTRGIGMESEFLCLFDNNGVLLSHPNPDMVGHSKATLEV